MKNKLIRASLAAGLLAFFAVGARGQGPQPIATVQGKGYPLNWLALSADGDRVAAARVNWTVGKGGQVVTVPGEVTVWDVQGGTKVSAFGLPGGDFNYVEFSGDGRSLLTVSHGQEGAKNVNSVGRGVEMLPAPLLVVTPNSAYQVWDVASGRSIDTSGPPPHLGLYSAVALSPDGRYLAVVFNTEVLNGTATTKQQMPEGKPARAPGRLPGRTPLRSAGTPQGGTGVRGLPLSSMTVREVIVLDTSNHKVKWRLPGVAHQGRISWSDSLAFSPDGKKLALFSSGSGGPTSDQSGTRSNRPQGTFKSLKMLLLEDGRSVPQVVFESMGLGDGALLWPTRGTSLLVRADRAIGLLDPAGGQWRGSSNLPFPQGLAARLQPGYQAPPPGIRPNDQPDGWFEPHMTLSADGSRAAAHFVYQPIFPKPKARENYVVLWDVASGRVMRWIRLADEPYGPGSDPDHPAGYNSLMKFTAMRIALSGDGRKLGVSDLAGTVRVYDVAGASGPATPAGPGNAPANGPPLASAKVATLRRTYEEAAARARAKLLASLDQSIQDGERNAAAGKGQPPPVVSRLTAERDAFEKHGLIPFSASTRSPTTDYLKALADERARVVTGFGSSPIPDDLRRLIDDRIIARWSHQAAGQKAPGTNTLYSGGGINDPRGEHRWSYSDGRLVLRWKNPQAPGGYWVDTCLVSPDGLSYAGTNQNKVKITGKLLVSH